MSLTADEVDNIRLYPTQTEDLDVPSASACALEIQHQALTHCLAFPHSQRRPKGRGLNLAAQLNIQRQTGQHCDCTLIVRCDAAAALAAGNSPSSRVLVLPAHKSVLAAGSDYFDGMLRHSLSTDSEFTLYFDSRDELDAFPSLLDYLYTGCTVFAEEHAIGLLLLSERMNLPRLQCGAVRYLTMFLRQDNVLPVWRALHQVSGLHAARSGSALQLSIHTRAKTERQVARDTLQRQKLSRVEHSRDKRMQRLAEKEEAARQQRDALDAADADAKMAQQQHIDQFKTVLAAERRRTQLEDARKKQADAEQRQRKAEEEAWRRQISQQNVAAAAVESGDVPATPRTPRTPTGQSSSSQARALLVAQALEKAKEKERAKAAKDAALATSATEDMSNPKARLLAKARAAFGQSSTSPPPKEDSPVKPTPVETVPLTQGNLQAHTNSQPSPAPVDPDVQSEHSSIESLFSLHSEAPPPPLVLARFVPLRCLLLQLDRVCISMVSNHLLDVVEVLYAIESDADRIRERQERILYKQQQRRAGVFHGDDGLNDDMMSDEEVEMDSDSEEFDRINVRDPQTAGRFSLLPKWIIPSQLQILLRQPALQVESEDQVLEIVAEFALFLTADAQRAAAEQAAQAKQPPRAPLQTTNKQSLPLLEYQASLAARRAAAVAAQLKEAQSAHLLVISALKNMIIRPALTLNAASTLLQPRFAPIAAQFLDVMQTPGGATFGSPSRSTSRASLHATRGTSNSLQSLKISSPSPLPAAFLSPAAAAPSCPPGVSSLLYSASQQASETRSDNIKRRAYVAASQLDWSGLCLNQHVRIFGKQHPHAACGVSSLAQTGSSTIAVGFFAESASANEEADQRGATRAILTGASGVPAAHDSNMALIDLRLQRGSEEDRFTQLSGHTTTTAMLPGAPHVINVLCTWRNLVIGGDGSGMLHVWAQSDPRRPESWIRQSCVQLDSGLSALQVWCDRLLCAQVDRPTQMRSLPDVSIVEQTLRVNESLGDAGLGQPLATARMTDDAAGADADACSQTWFFPSIEVGGHPGFVTAQSALTVWMRDPHFSHPSAVGGDYKGVSGAVAVDTSDPELADAEDEAEQGYAAVRVRPGESRVWLAPCADEQAVRCVAVAHLSPLDSAPVFGLAVSADQMHIYCGLELTGQVLEVRLCLTPHAYLERVQRINVFDNGSSVSRIMLMDDVMLAASSSAAPEDLQLSLQDEAEDSYLHLDMEKKIVSSRQSRLKVLRRAPTIMPDAQLSVALNDMAINSAASSPAALAVNPFNAPAWDAALVESHTGVSHHAGSHSVGAVDPAALKAAQAAQAELEALASLPVSEDPDLLPLPARMRRVDDEPLPPPPPNFCLDQVEPRAWHVVHHLAVSQPIFDFCVVDRALVVGGTEGDLLVFASCD